MANEQDATMLIQLAQWSTQLGLDEIYVGLFKGDIVVDGGDDFDARLFKVLTFGETVGTLTKNGLLDTDLVLDWIWASGLWERVAPVARRHREHFNEPGLWANFELLAAKQR